MVLSKVDSFGSPRQKRAETARQLSVKEEFLNKIGPAIWMMVLGHTQMDRHDLHVSSYTYFTL